jgi:hypothetical protein
MAWALTKTTSVHCAPLRSQQKEVYVNVTALYMWKMAPPPSHAFPADHTLALYNAAMMQHEGKGTARSCQHATTVCPTPALYLGV